MMMPAARTANNTAAANHIPLASSILKLELSRQLRLVAEFASFVIHRTLRFRKAQTLPLGYALMHRLLYCRFDCGETVLDRLLHLFEGARLDLAHALARHSEFVS